jgi:hypothetical protein
VRRSKPKNRSSSHAEGRKFGGRVSRFLALWRDYHDLLQVGSSPCPLFHLHPIFRVAYYLRRVHIFKSVLLDCRSLAHSVPSLLHLFYCCSVSLLLFFFCNWLNLGFNCTASVSSIKGFCLLFDPSLSYNLVSRTHELSSSVIHCPQYTIVRKHILDSVIGLGS